MNEHELPDETDQENQSRRSFLGFLGLGTIVAGFLGQMGIYVKSLFPRTLYEPPRTIKVGKPGTFNDGLTFLKEERVFIHRQENRFRAISAVCTHLGCTVNNYPMSESEMAETAYQEKYPWEFHCPCHGSKFRADGENFAGPAPKPLPHYDLTIAPDDGQLVVKLDKILSEDEAILKV